MMPLSLSSSNLNPTTIPATQLVVAPAKNQAPVVIPSKPDQFTPLVKSRGGLEPDFLTLLDYFSGKTELAILAQCGRTKAEVLAFLETFKYDSDLLELLIKVVTKEADPIN